MDNQTPHPSIKPRHSTKWFFAITGLVLLFMGVVATGAWYSQRYTGKTSPLGQVSNNQAQDYFATIPQIAKSYYYAQAKVLGIQPKATDLVKSCSDNDAQYPYDSGYPPVHHPGFTCGVGAKATVNKTTVDLGQANDLFDTMIAVSMREGFAETQYLGAPSKISSFFDDNEKDSCAITLAYNIDTVAEKSTPSPVLADIQYSLNCGKFSPKLLPGYTLSK
jgi:hypothetical protein